MKNVTKLLMMIIISALVLFATACGPQAQLKLKAQKSSNQDDSGLTGAKNDEGKDYASFTPELERDEMEKFIPQTPTNKDFAQNIKSVKAEIDNKNLKVTVKWSGIEKPLVFSGLLTAKNNFFMADLQETTNQRNDLSLRASCADTDCMMINAFIQDREDHRAGLMIRKEERVLKLKIPTSEKENVKLLSSEKQAAFAEAEKGRNIVLTSTEVISGISDYDVKADTGSIKGDVTDTTVADQKAITDGVFSDLGTVELVGSNSRKGDIIFKVQSDVDKKTEESKPNIFDRILGKKPKVEVDATKSVQKVTGYLVTEPRTPEQTEKRKNPIPLPVKGTVTIPKLNPHLDSVVKASGKVDPLVQQILNDSDNKFVKKYMSGNLIATVDKSGKTKKNFDLDFYLACLSGDSTTCKGKADSAKRIVDILRSKNFPAAMSTIAYFESNFTANAQASTSTAYGWWQFLKGTARANDLDPKTFGTAKDERADLEKSTVAATKYFTKLLDMWKGDLKMTIISYHYGEGNMQEVCQKSTGDKDCVPSVGKSTVNYNKFIKDLGDQYEILSEKEKFWYLYESRMIKNINEEKQYGDRVVKFLGYSLVSFDPKSYGYDDRLPVELY